MSSNKDNIIFEKTSFLQGSNSSFIKELYLKYLSNPKSIPQSWLEFFDGLNEEQEVIKKEILGPSWAPKKNNNLKINVLEKSFVEDKQASINGTSILKLVFFLGAQLGPRISFFIISCSSPRPSKKTCQL